MAIVTHSVVEEDPRVRREAEALVAGRLGGRRLRAPPARRRRHAGAGRGVTFAGSTSGATRAPASATYLVEYLAFLVRAAWALDPGPPPAALRARPGPPLPDFLVFAALPLRLAGVPVILDLHEAMPEFFRSRFPRAANPVAYRLLRLQERVSIGLARAAIYRQRRAARPARRARLPARTRSAVVPNSPSLARFDRRDTRHGRSWPTARSGSSTPAR